MTQGRIRHWAAVATAPPAIDDLSVLLPDWRTHLRSRNVAPSTIASYLKVGDNLLVWLREAGMPTGAAGIAREHLEAFLAALSDRVSPATVAKHYRSLQQLFRWLVEDGEIGHSPMERMRPPAVPEQPVDILTDGQFRALLDAARGNTFENRRETAIPHAHRHRHARRGAGRAVAPTPRRDKHQRQADQADRPGLPECRQPGRSYPARQRRLGRQREHPCQRDRSPGTAKSPFPWRPTPRRCHRLPVHDGAGRRVWKRLPGALLVATTYPGPLRAFPSRRKSPAATPGRRP